MNTEDSNLWLKKLINTKNFDSWLAVSFLYRYPTVGIHEYICKKLKHTKNITLIIPQLVHVFLYHSDSEISKPVYNLMKYRSIKSRKFFLSLYFYLKASIENLESKKSIYCYFLICDMFKEESRYKKNRIIFAQLKYKRRFHKMPVIVKDKKNISNFDGIFLCFLRSVMWVCDLKVFKNIRDYEKIFQQSKNISKINFKPNLSTGHAFNSDLIRSSIAFIESLIDISYRLNKLPKSLRQKGLEMELKLINCNLPAKITLPFSKMKYLLSVRIELSNILNSAENTPFVVVIEVADKSIAKNKMDSQNAAFIMQQLNAVSGLTYISDTNNIKDNVLVSLEQILDVDRRFIENDEITTNVNYKIDKINEQWKLRHNNSKSKENCMQKLNIIDKVSSSDFIYSNSTDFVQSNIMHSHSGDTNTQKIKENMTISDTKKCTLNNEESDMSSVFFTDTKQKITTLVKVQENSKTDWEIKEDITKKSSKFGHLRNWHLVSLIVKTGCSLKQEVIAYQLLSVMQQIWNEEGKDIWIKVYQIYFVNDNAGLVETISDAFSIHKIKEMGKQENRNFSLKSYFLDKFGSDTEEYKKATHNFLISLVGYSLACYLLQVKDRHNGNILLDSEGHIIHVDFGFILGDHPGFYCVEVAPFKFSNEYEELLKDFTEDFKILFLEGFIALRKHSERLCRILEILSDNSDIKCVNKKTLNAFKDRLKLEMSDKEIECYVLFLINKSLNSMGTGLYDFYQYFSNGYI